MDNSTDNNLDEVTESEGPADSPKAISDEMPTAPPATERIGVARSKNFDLDQLRRPLKTEGSASTNDRPTGPSPFAVGSGSLYDRLFHRRARRYKRFKEGLMQYGGADSPMASKGPFTSGQTNPIISGGLNKMIQRLQGGRLRKEKLTPEQEQKQKQEEEKKKKNAKFNINAAKAAINASAGNYVGAVIDIFKAFMANPKKFALTGLLACAPWLLVILIGVSILVVGIQNMLPGSKSGTTFGQNETTLDTLTQLRMRTSGDQASRAKQIVVDEKIIADLFNNMQSLRNQVDSTSLSDADKKEVKALIDTAIIEIKNFQSIKPADRNTDTGLKAAKSVLQAVDQVVNKMLEPNIGKPNSKSNFYPLPDSKYYVKKGDPSNLFARIETISALTLAAKDFNAKYPKYKLAIINLSKAEGGPLDSRPSHQCGRDVDLALVHVDKPESFDGALAPYLRSGDQWIENFNVSGIPGDGKSFNAALARSLGDILLASGFETIGFEYPLNDYSKFQKEIDGLKGHRDHLYAAIPGNQKYPACLENVPVQE